LGGGKGGGGVRGEEELAMGAHLPLEGVLRIINPLIR